MPGRNQDALNVRSDGLQRGQKVQACRPKFGASVPRPRIQALHRTQPGGRRGKKGVEGAEKKEKLERVKGTIPGIQPVD